MCNFNVINFILLYAHIRFSICFYFKLENFNPLKNSLILKFYNIFVLLYVPSRMEIDKMNFFLHMFKVKLRL